MALVILGEELPTGDPARISESISNIFHGILHGDDYYELCHGMYLQHRDREYVLDVLRRLCMQLCLGAMSGKTRIRSQMD